MKVANKKIIRRLSFRSMKAASVRNRIAVLAIALTTVLFTALFTIAMSISYGFQQSNFRRVGGYAHGGFKYITKEQVDELKTDPLIKEYGIKYSVGKADEKPFNKDRLEINYVDENEAKFSYMEPVEGRLPAENTNEAATDTRVLELLGVEPEIGAEFEMTFNVDGKDTTQTFTLSGWWEYDPIAPARQMAIPMSRAEAIFNELGTAGNDGITKTYSLDVMFRSSANIDRSIKTVVERHGFQNESAFAGSNYIRTGVNWGYVTTELGGNLDSATALSIAAALLLIIFTGYLIIYNVFQISVSNDVRSYGLLKTIGTTGRQIRRIVRIQSLLLSCIGIPIGLILGYLIGAVLTPVALGTLSNINTDTLSVSPWIFVGALIFSLITVAISCRKPSKIASKVSPIEALRYIEGNNIRKKKRYSKKGASLFSMALANLGRNKAKTIVTVVSMSLAVVLFQLTVILTDGFSMDKYLRNTVVDFLISDSSYFTVHFSDPDKGLSDKVIDEIKANEGIIDGGRTYADSGLYIEEIITEENYRHHYRNSYYPQNLVEQRVEGKRLDNGLIHTDINLYGMDKFILDKLNIYDGDISKLSEEGNYVAAVYFLDDYGETGFRSNWARVGDTVTIRYFDEYEMYNTVTGEIYASYDDIPDDARWDRRAIKYRDVDYEVVAAVECPSKLSYRMYSGGQFIMGTETFLKYTQNDVVMYYAFDTTDEAREDMEAFMSDYTRNVRTEYDYESRKGEEKEFYSLRDMYRLMGVVLSCIVGIIGILNFFNAILTGIITRRHEFAVLQSVGMTGKQLNKMLVIEGFFYAAGVVISSVVLSIAVGPIASNALTSIFWFFEYKYTIVPILAVAPFFIALGVIIPLATYRLTAKKSVVERLREAA